MYFTRENIWHTARRFLGPYRDLNILNIGGFPAGVHMGMATETVFWELLMLRISGTVRLKDSQDSAVQMK